MPSDSTTRAWLKNAADEVKLAFCREQLSSAVLGDVMDVMGLQQQFLPPEVRSLEPTMVVAGRAMPVVLEQVHGIPSEPFGRLTEALDQLRQGEVYLAAAAGLPCASWGEILTATAIGRGAAGAVIDGFHRDTVGVLRQQWPVFSRGAYGQDAGARSVVVDFRVRVTIGSVHVSPGDLVFGDVDGVAIVPRDVEDEVLHRATMKRSTEGKVLDEIASGLSSGAAFERYGVL